MTNKHRTCDESDIRPLTDHKLHKVAGGSVVSTSHFVSLSFTAPAHSFSPIALPPNPC
jgi:hypothetical protein